MIQLSVPGGKEMSLNNFSEGSSVDFLKTANILRFSGTANQATSGSGIQDLVLTEVITLCLGYAIQIAGRAHIIE